MKLSPSFVLGLLAFVTSCATVSPHQLVKDQGPIGKGPYDEISAAQFEVGSFTSSRGTNISYRFLRPSVEVTGTSYPLVVQLHGSAGIGADNVSQLDRLAKSWATQEIRARYRAFVLVPQFPIRSANYGPAAPDQHAVSSAALDDALELVKSFVSTHAVDTSRIYATGFSMGGSAAWLLPQLAPTMFAAIVPISGIAPPNAQVGNVIGLPVLALHGNADAENPITADRRFVEAIRSAGGKRATLREYEGLAHQPPADAFPGFWWRDWLFRKRRE